MRLFRRWGCLGGRTESLHDRRVCLRPRRIAVQMLGGRTPGGCATARPQPTTEGSSGACRCLRNPRAAVDRSAGRSGGHRLNSRHQRATRPRQSDSPRTTRRRLSLWPVNSIPADMCPVPLRSPTARLTCFDGLGEFGQGPTGRGCHARPWKLLNLARRLDETAVRAFMVSERDRSGRSSRGGTTRRRTSNVKRLDRILQVGSAVERDSQH